MPLRLLLALLVCLLLPATAQAELVQRGNLFVRFDGRVSPKNLPRHVLAPIAVRIEGTVRVIGGARPPAMRRITVALNRAGHLETRGLPVCRRRQIELKSSAEALAACGPALVGSGGTVARITLPNQAPTTVRAEMLLFNGRFGGRAAILGHVYHTRPATVTRTIIFKIRRGGGTFGTVLTGRITPDIERNGYLKSFFLQLQRRYVSRGRPRSYLSAACSAPPGFTLATFPFARAAIGFEGGRTLSSTLIRSCGVRGR